MSSRPTMTYFCLGVAFLVGLLAVSSPGPAAAQDSKNPAVVLDTSLGEIVIELDQAKAPKTVENFLKYVDDHFYDKTVFHRVIDGFMIQGGGFSEDLAEKKTREAIKNESSNGLSNVRGTIAMARKNDPHSATAQFFINLVDKNRQLDTYGGGYTVFGKVTKGMDVVDKIAKVPTGQKPGKHADGTPDRFDDVPLENVVVKSVKRVGK